MTLLDPIITAAVSISEGRGVYVPFIGSGVSRSAGIPTGWEITLDLVKKIAAGAGIPADESLDWYQREFGDPEYDRVLDAVAPTPTQRMLILRSYFEPTDAEKASGLKAPTRAHRTIAKLVAEGYFKVVVTTNFDRLLEQALDSEGVAPTVIASVDTLKGALPLTHSRVTLVKVHGDYLDTRIRNTTSELSSYEPEMDRLLDRIFDEHGLLIVGWSAIWDAALRIALLRQPSRRFRSYFCSRGPLSAEGSQLVTARDFTVVDVADSDSFFDTLSARLKSLAELNRHPMSDALTVATYKRMLDDPAARVARADLLRVEARKVAAAVLDERLAVAHKSAMPAEPLALLERYETLTQPFVTLFALACSWEEDGDFGTQQAFAVAAGGIDPDSSGTRLNLTRYGAAYVTYLGGVAATAAEKYRTISRLADTLLYSPVTKRKLEVSLLTQSSNVFYHVQADQIFAQNYYTPLSSYLFERLRQPLHEIVPSDADYHRAFDRFELLWALAAVDRQLQRTEKYLDFVVGSFLWKRDEITALHPEEVLLSEFRREGEAWQPLFLFGRDPQRAELAFEKLNQHLGAVRQRLPL